MKQYRSSLIMLCLVFSLLFSIGWSQTTTQNSLFISESAWNHHTIAIDAYMPVLEEFASNKENILREREKRLLAQSLLALCCILLGFTYWKLRRVESKYKKLLLKTKQRTAKENTSSKAIPLKITDSILRNINTFEREKGYLDPTITLQSLAKELGTNSSYLSKIVNRDKEKSFAKYISDLRIEHSIQRLKTDRKFLNYKISAIAQDTGFSTTESFSRAFKKKTGQHPSHFMTQLKEKTTQRTKSVVGMER